LLPSLLFQVLLLGLYLVGQVDHQQLLLVPGLLYLLVLVVRELLGYRPDLNQYYLLLL
jgi:hypothetical protein